jgi:hypothetical protein
MASRDGGGGGFFWGLVGFLLGVAATLGLLAYLSREPSDGFDPHTAADEAASEAQALPDAGPSPQRVEPPPVALPAPREEARPVPERAPDPGRDPAADDQMSDDAAASGMTSRAPPSE